MFTLSTVINIRIAECLEVFTTEFARAAFSNQTASSGLQPSSDKALLACLIFHIRTFIGPVRPKFGTLVKPFLWLSDIL